MELCWIACGTVLMCVNASLQVLQVRAGQEARVFQAGLELRALRVTLEVLESLVLLDHQVTVTRTHGVFLSPFRDLLICLLTLEEAEVQYENDY